MITASTIKVIIFLVLLALSALSWAFKKMAEQKQIKRAREMRERQSEQMLRTGRTEDGIAVPTATALPTPAAPNPVAGHADARRRLQELAERRQRQLEELRKKQGNAGPTVTSAGSPVPTIERPPPSRTTDMRPGSQPTLPAPSRQAPQPQQKKAQPKPQQAKRAVKPQTRQEVRDANQPARDRAGRTPEQAARQALADRAESEATHPAQGNSSDAAAAAQRKGAESLRGALSGAKRGGGMNASDWRRVMMMREILDKPMSDRE